MLAEKYQETTTTERRIKTRKRCYVMFNTERYDPQDGYYIRQTLHRL